MLRRTRRPGPDPLDPMFQPEPEPDGLDRLARAEREAQLRAGLAGARRPSSARCWSPPSTTASATARSPRRSGLPLGTVKSRIRLAFQRLRGALGADLSGGARRWLTPVPLVDVWRGEMVGVPAPRACGDRRRPRSGDRRLGRPGGGDLSALVVQDAAGAAAARERRGRGAVVRAAGARLRLAPGRGDPRDAGGGLARRPRARRRRPALRAAGSRRRARAASAARRRRGALPGAQQLLGQARGLPDADPASARRAASTSRSATRCSRRCARRSRR